MPNGNSPLICQFRNVPCPETVVAFLRNHSNGRLTPVCENHFNAIVSHLTHMSISSRTVFDFGFVPLIDGRGPYSHQLTTAEYRDQRDQKYRQEEEQRNRSIPPADPRKIFSSFSSDTIACFSDVNDINRGTDPVTWTVYVNGPARLRFQLTRNPTVYVVTPHVYYQYRDWSTRRHPNAITVIRLPRTHDVIEQVSICPLGDPNSV